MVLTFVVALVVLLVHPSTANAHLLYFMLGQLTSYVGTIVNYHFRSTAVQSPVPPSSMTD
jgi:hypothetical protein